MKPGLKPGVRAEVTFTVTEAMLAGFDDAVVHPVLSTVSMIYHMEKAGRMIILPYLEPDEEGAGYEVCVRHLRPAVVGETVVVEATARAVDERFVVADVRARVGERVIGEGTFTQVLFRKETLARKIGALKQALKRTTGGA
ncbi:MAG: hypothetical protein HSCHL_0456 [Hydrogenibacillus schlegelii]|uniref:Fluoroacetyl-CoA-specific thioesterase-like domain-containing protein n=1 Tax=Hydrogenibacillus schlegelii TaxID=1484 RepID=A0A2T5G810_HYDSH|nr:thioesterase [Hydrogenibacillus schlegelii]PTQ52330.1 MAG: hypothetical protein HSCHL_0456 [Hydrogenibacillus schlegelii]